MNPINWKVIIAILNILSVVLSILLFGIYLFCSFEQWPTLYLIKSFLKRAKIGIQLVKSWIMLPLPPLTRKNEANSAFIFFFFWEAKQGFLRQKHISLKWKSKVSFHCMQPTKPAADLFLWPQFVASVIVCLAHKPSRSLSWIFQSSPLVCILFVWLSDFNQKLEKTSKECQHLPTHFHPYRSNTQHHESSWGAWHVPLDLLHATEFWCKRLSCLIKELVSSCSFKYNPPNACARLF